MLTRLCSKSFKARLQQYINQELSDVQAGFRKGRGTRDEISNIHWIIKDKARELKKEYTSASVITLKSDDFDHNKLWNIVKQTEINQPPYLPLEKPVCRTRSKS